MHEVHLYSAGDPVAGREVVVVDPEVADADILLRSLKTTARVVWLRQGAEPLGQIVTAFGGMAGIRRLHVLSHGAPGSLRLAERDLELDDFLRHPTVLPVLRSVLADDAEIVLYGCEVAALASGARFVAGLSTALDATVVSSDLPVGRGGATGGSWQAFSEDRCAFGAAGRAAYPGLLASGTIAFEDASTSTSVTSTSNGVTVTVTIDANTVTGGDRIIDVAAGGGLCNSSHSSQDR